MSLIHGSQGIIYFAHQFEPAFIEATLLKDPEMVKTLTLLNRQIAELSAPLNAPSVTNLLQLHTENAAVPIAHMVKQHAGFIYIFAGTMRPGKTKGHFTILASTKTKVEVLGEIRTIKKTGANFSDQFGLWEAHLYRLAVEAPH